MTEYLLILVSTILVNNFVLVLFAAMRERIAVSDVPVAFRGAAIGMITAGLMSLAFLGFTGLVTV